MCSADIFLGLLAILFPPLPVWVKCGLCSADSIINILLCMLGYIPGLIHSWYIIAKYPEPSYDYDPVPSREAGGHSARCGRSGHRHGGERVYVIVHDRPSSQQGGSKANANKKPAGYGTTAAPSAAPASSSAAGPSSAPTTAAAQLEQGQQQQRQDEAGPSDGAPPPSYAQVVAGDHKVQTTD